MVQRRRFLATAGTAITVATTAGCLSSIPGVSGGGKIESVGFDGNTVIVSLADSDAVSHVNLVGPNGEEIRGSTVDPDSGTATFPWHRYKMGDFQKIQSGDYKVIAVSEDDNEVGTHTIPFTSKLNIESVQTRSQLNDGSAEGSPSGSLHFTLTNPGEPPVWIDGLTIDMDTDGRFASAEKTDWEQYGGVRGEEAALETAVVGGDETQTWVSHFINETDSCSTGTHTGTVTVHFPGDEKQAYNLEVEATGEPAQENTDAFGDTTYYCEMDVVSFEPVNG